jgi:hypothetical protein
MAEIPGWWLDLSAAFFVVAIVYVAALTVAVVKALQLAQENSPRVAAIEKDVQALVTRVHEVAGTVEDTAGDLKIRVHSIGASAENVAGSVEVAAKTTSKQFIRFSPWVAGILSAYKVFTGIRDRNAKRAHAR